MSNRETDRSNETEPEVKAPPSDEFVQLFTLTQRRIYLFILAQIPNPTEAEELLQNTNLVIWSKYHQFKLGTNFFAWACQISRFEVLKYRERKSHEKLRFNDDFVQWVADEAEENADLLEMRRQALGQCLNKLRSRDRELIQMRYAPGESGKSIAEFLGRPCNSVYQSLSRIRQVLGECVNRQVAEQSQL
ncbi:MAG: sigma-70 family RNA polymerase sigma factor [Planctomycetota bacterium]|nr:sigma-70 family RNA polymerase sigma factor [Planctomycetota bacterium]